MSNVIDPLLPFDPLPDTLAIRDLLSEIRHLTTPMQLIADDRRQCATCGIDALDSGPDRDHPSCPEPGRCSWVAGNHVQRARNALDQRAIRTGMR